jgi:hypothetical protein
LRILKLEPSIGINIGINKIGLEDDRNEILKILGKPIITGTRYVNVIFDSYEDMTLRYDNNILNQIQIEKIKNRKLQ